MMAGGEISFSVSARGLLHRRDFLFLSAKGLKQQDAIFGNFEKVTEKA